jgi:AraC family transcriptional regulator, regulatory protein of adaptative response / DNA-3-methyladenine glycosylase II
VSKRLGTSSSSTGEASPPGDGLFPTLDAAVCERARLSRDARFDGRFFIGVRTTGIYCRPVCPVKPPLQRNVVFFPTAAAAAEAGFRPCLRCRPEQSAGTPDWCGMPEIVGRALRLIAIDPVEDDRGVARVAARLGVTARHLQRLFQRHLGAAPLAVIRTRRVHTAKRLLDETDLGMADIAFAAGFGSVRRFNATFRDLYDRTPRELRAARGRDRDAGAPRDGFQFRLAYRPPLDWDHHLSYLVPRAIPGVEDAAGGVYRRTFRVGGQVGALEVRPAADGGPALELRTTAVEPAHLPDVIERARRVFDLGADPAVIREHLRRDPELRPWVDRCRALRVPGAWDGFELAIRAVIGQQISVVAATTITGRLASRWGSRIFGADDGAAPGAVNATPAAGHVLGAGNCALGGAGGAASIVFPRPEALVDADLAAIGLPRARGETLRLLARAVASGDVALEPGADPRAVREALIAIPGIGEWTAQYVALRALGEPDAFPASDLGLLRSPANGGARNPRQLLERAEAWRPWRGYAAIVLWRAYGAAAQEAAAVRAANSRPASGRLATPARSTRTRNGIERAAGEPS